MRAPPPAAIAVDGAIVEVALNQAHRLPVEDVDRRVEDHAGVVACACAPFSEDPPVHSAAKLRSIRSPWTRGLLGVELRAVDALPADDADERPAVVAHTEHVLLVQRVRDVGVHVVEGCRVGESFEQRRPRAPANLTPADVRKLQRRRVERTNRAADQPEALGASVLVGAVEQQLHAQAAAEQRHAGADDARAAAHRGRASLSSCIAGGEGADARQHEPVRRAQRVVIGGEHSARTDALDGLLDGAAVADAVVDDADRRSLRAHSSASPWWTARRSRSGRSRRPGAAHGRTP